MSIPVVLRNGEPARISGGSGIKPYPVQGFRLAAPDEGELWTRDGHWRDDGEGHEFDIVSIVAPDGQVRAVKEILV